MSNQDAHESQDSPFLRRIGELIGASKPQDPYRAAIGLLATTRSDLPAALMRVHITGHIRSVRQIPTDNLIQLEMTCPIARLTGWNYKGRLVFDELDGTNLLGDVAAAVRTRSKPRTYSNTTILLSRAGVGFDTLSAFVDWMADGTPVDYVRVFNVDSEVTLRELKITDGNHVLRSGEHGIIDALRGDLQPGYWMY